MATTYLRRLDPLSLAKVMGLCYALIGFIAGAIIALLSLVGAGLGSMMAESGAEPWMAAVFGVGSIIFLPLFYGVIGFIGGLLFGLFINLALRWTGGLQLELG